MRPDLTKEFLLQAYVNSGQSLKEFSEQTGWHVQTICQKMRKFGIGKKSLGVAKAAPVGGRLLSKEYLSCEYSEKNRTTYAIAEEHNVSPAFVQRRLKMFEIPRRSRGDYCDKVDGKRFGRLVTSGRSRIRTSHGRRRTEILCRCDCGQSKWVRRCHLISDGTQSCGCLEEENLQKIQEECKTGYGEITGSHWARIRSRAHHAKMEFSISIEYAWSLFEKQARKCALTGHDIQMPGNGCRSKLEHVFNEDGIKYASLDRINSKLGYIDGNLQWVWAPLNVMKWNLSQNGFIAICTDVAKHSCVS